MPVKESKAEKAHKSDLIARKLKPYAKWLMAHKFSLKGAADKHGVSYTTLRTALNQINPDISPKHGVASKPIGHDTRRWSLIQHYVMTHDIGMLSADEIAHNCLEHIQALCARAGTTTFEVSPHCIIAACESKHLPVPVMLDTPPKNLI